MLRFVESREVIDRERLYESLGYARQEAPRLDNILIEAGVLERAGGKKGIALSKRARVQEVLQARCVRLCRRGDCQQEARLLGRMPVRAAEDSLCEVCAGSVNRRAVEDMVCACQAAGVRRLCIVGGNQATRQELRRLVGRRLDLRLVEGDRRHTAAQAERNRRWADLVIIWGNTVLEHQVTRPYQGLRGVLRTNRRGIADLASQIARHLRTRGR